MFGAIYIGLSGLDAYSRGLQQVSNNVTNLNTTGFKASTVVFQDYFGETDNGGLSHTVTSRGSGNGVGMGEPMLDLKQGELRQSDRDLDLAVDGTGFLVLLDGNNTFYARTGSFEVDKDGFIVLSGTQYRLATLDAGNHPVALSIDSHRTSTPKPTTAIKFGQYLSSSATDPVLVSDLKVYDAQGGQHVWKVTFTRDTDATGNGWKVKVTDETGATVGSEGTLRYDSLGAVDDATKTMTVTGANNFTVTLDFTGTQSFSSGNSSSISASSIDGQAVGTVTTVAVNDKGELELAYSNGQKLAIGAVALADFRDTSGLKQKTGGIFAFEGSGERILATSEDQRVGQVLSKRLEASNVDLSKQFGDLILIQRGFQAASQIVSVSNDMIQQLFGIRGQA